MGKGLFITFEGPDGAGKTTQISYLEDYFKKAGIDVVMTREPGGTRIGERIRDIILDNDHTEMDSMTETLLYAAARAQHVAEVIAPALDQGKVVICDRFVDSSIAYQSWGRKLGVAVEEINRFATGGLTPALTFLLLIDPEEGRRRAEKGRQADRLELEENAFHRAVYRGYCQLAKSDPERIVTVDAVGEIDEIHKIIVDRVKWFIEKTNNELLSGKDL
ncbi:MAG: dTMP kinase [Anaerovoracaceae bacterium]|jgi:dTMP kinase